MNQEFEKFILDETLYPKPMSGEKKRYLLKKDEESELILMIWGAGAISPIHDHAGSECWTSLLKGELVEKTFHKFDLSLEAHMMMEKNKISYSDKDEGVHQILNESIELAYSLHLYKKPMSHCHVFDQNAKNWMRLENIYDDLRGINL